MPSLPKRLQSSGINEPIVPRRRLSASGRKDLLTPPAGGWLYPTLETEGREPAA